MIFHVYAMGVYVVALCDSHSFIHIISNIYV